MYWLILTQALCKLLPSQRTLATPKERSPSVNTEGRNLIARRHDEASVRAAGERSRKRSAAEAKPKEKKQSSDEADAKKAKTAQKSFRSKTKQGFGRGIERPII
eukprot:g27449.t1